MTTGLRISICTAFIGGIILPILETIRRWNQMRDPQYFMAWFDDYIIGIFLVIGAYTAYKHRHTGWLATAWGFATGIAFFSFYAQMQILDGTDPAPVSSATVAVVKGIMLLICIICMVISATAKKF